jgi:hypothetical protein
MMLDSDKRAHQDYVLVPTTSEGDKRTPCGHMRAAATSDKNQTSSCGRRFQLGSRWGF